MTDPREHVTDRLLDLYLALDTITDDTATVAHDLQAIMQQWLTLAIARVPTTVGAPEWERRALDALYAVETRIARLRPVIARHLTGVNRDLAEALAAAGAGHVQAREFVTQLTGAFTSAMRAMPREAKWAVAMAARRIRSGDADVTRVVHDAALQIVRRGPHVLRDSAGRRWAPATYIEMATRSIAQRAHTAASLNAASDTGTPYVVVSDHHRECPRCRPWEGRVLRTDGVRDDNAQASLAEAQAAGLHHPNCFPADTPVQAPSGIRAAYRRWYQGPMVVVQTSLGAQITVTQNHPILTAQGWVAAGELKHGDCLVRHSIDVEPMLAVGPHDQQVPATIGEVFDTLRQSSEMTTVCVPAAPEQFHGDGGNGDVDVVLADSLLQHGDQAATFERGADGALVIRRVRLGALPPGGSPLELVAAAPHAPQSIMGGCGDRSSLVGSHAGKSSAHHRASVDAGASRPENIRDLRLRQAMPSSDLGLSGASAVLGDDRRDITGRPRLYQADLPESGADRLDADAEGGRDLALRLASEVAPCYVVDIKVEPEWAGHVFNLETVAGWYGVTSNIVVHNCRHQVYPWWSDYDQQVPGVPDPALYSASQRQRALERRVRSARIEADAEQALGVRYGGLERLATARSRLRDHLDAWPELKRSRRREVPRPGDLVLR